MSIKTITIPPKTLSQSITAASVSFVPSDIKGWDGVDLTSASFGSVAFGAFISADKTILELFSFDPTTIASASVSFVTRGLAFTGANTNVPANQLAWPAGTTTIQLGSDIPQLFTLIGFLANVNVWTALNTFNAGAVVVGRVQTVTNAATITPAADTNDEVNITAIAQAFTVANPTGTPVNFQRIIMRILDNGTGRAITWGNQYRAMGNALPTTTIASKRMICCFMWDSVDSKWDLVSLNNQL